MTLSRLERQSDILISTLTEMARGLGGRLRTLAELPDRPPVYLTGFADITAETPPKRSAGSHAGKAAAKVSTRTRRKSVAA